MPKINVVNSNVFSESLRFRLLFKLLGKNGSSPQISHSILENIPVYLND